MKVQHPTEFPAELSVTLLQWKIVEDDRRVPFLKPAQGKRNSGRIEEYKQ